MQKRVGDAANWRALSLNGFKSAKLLFDNGDYRGCANRAYYAAYHAAVAASLKYADDFARGWSNPSHDQLPDLIRNNGDLPVATRRRIARLLRILREERESADYRPGPTIDRENARDCIHGATTVLALLEVLDE